MHFGVSEGIGGGGVNTWKSCVVGYGYFLELPIVVLVAFQLVKMVSVLFVSQ